MDQTKSDPVIVAPKQVIAVATPSLVVPATPENTPKCRACFKTAYREHVCVTREVVGLGGQKSLDHVVEHRVNCSVHGVVFSMEGHRDQHALVTSQMMKHQAEHNLV